MNDDNPIWSIPMEPVEVVRGIYEAFGRGDISGVLSRVALDVTWIDPGFPDVPYAGVRRGREGVADFFDSLSLHTEFTSFAPNTFVTSGSEVVVFGGLEGRDRHSGARFRSDWAMRWKVEDGLVTFHQSYADTSAIARALGTVRPILMEAAG